MFNYLFDQGTAATQRIFNALPWLVIAILFVLFMAAGGASFVHDWVETTLKLTIPVP